MLKVLHVPFTFAPDPIGGTEVYVEALSRELRSFEIESVIAAPSNTGADEVYDYNGIRVHRFRSAPESIHMLRELYGAGDPEAGRAFARILDEETPDVVHFHAFTRAVSVRLVRMAKKRKINVFFTYHTPTISCQRGTLMLWGKEACDGVLDVHRCTDCSLAGAGMPRWASMPLSYIPSSFAKVLEGADLSGGLWTALRMTDLIRARCEAFLALSREVDGIVALREWVRALLVNNGVSPGKIHLSPHGLAFGYKPKPLVDVKSVPLRVAFLGRADYVKGMDTLIKAVRAAPELQIELHLYGVTQESAGSGYRATLESLADGDARISFLDPIPHDDVIPLLASYHLLAMPSRTMETGPLVILESFAAGTPVLGSNLGNIAEWVQHEKNGLLVNFEDVAEWTDALRRCAEDRFFLGRLREGVKQPRSMTDVARDMAQMYRGQVNSDTQSTIAVGA